MKLTTQQIGILEFSLAMTLSGTIGIFVKESQQLVINVVFFRCVFGLLFLAAYFVVTRKITIGEIPQRTWLIMVASGVALVINWYFLFESYRYAGIGIATVAYHTQPFILLFLASWFLKEHIEAYKYFWVATAFVGLLFIVNPQGELQSSFLLGILYASLAAVFYAVTMLLVKQLSDAPALVTVMVQLLTGALLLLPLTSLSEVGGKGDHWYWLIALGLVHTCFMYLILYSGIVKLSTPLVSVLSYWYPLVAVLADYIIYGISLSWVQWGGMTLILFAGFAMNREIKWSTLTISRQKLAK